MMRMVLAGIGANLPSPRFGAPVATCRAALARLEASGMVITHRSRWYRSLPVPASDQPPFVNAVFAVATTLPAADLLDRFHAIEKEFGRHRQRRNEARILDLDLLAYGELVSGPDDRIRLPHPRLHERAFVLKPMMDIAPHWRHPLLGLTIAELLARVPAGQEVTLFEA